MKIIVGNSEPPIQFQQSVLEGISRYFTSAFGNERFEEGKSGILRLPEDSVEVWKIISKWIIHREIPETLIEEDLLLAIRCWTTGDKYDIKEFQDAVMLCMLIELSSDSDPSITDPKLSPEMVQVAFENTAVGSPLRNLVVERKVLEYRSEDYQDAQYQKMWEDLRFLDGTGFVPHLVKARKEIEDWGRLGFTDGGAEGRHTLWRPFMVGTSKNQGMLLPEFSIRPIQDDEDR